MNFTRLTTKAEVEALMGALPPVVAVDTEYDGKDSRTAKLLTVVIAIDPDTAYSIPAKFAGLLVDLSECQELRLQNFKVDYEILARYGVDLLATPCKDAMLLHHLVDENSPHSLDWMVQSFYQDNYKEVFWSKYKTYAEAPREEALAYECKDACYTYRIVDKLMAELEGREALVEHVHSLAKALYRTEVEGIPVDFDLMLKTEQEMAARINSLLPAMRSDFLDYCQLWEMENWSKAYDKAISKLKTEKGRANCKVKKEKFNFGSDKQLAWLIYEKLKLPVLKKTKRTPKGGGGNPSVDYEAIDLLKQQGHSLGSIGEYKEIKNLYATFCVGLIGRVECGRIYPEFNVNGTVTGRISHSNPNMGNMPKDGPFRNFFLPTPGCVLVGADYGQLEVVVEANITGDKNLAKIVLDGLSKHDITAQSLGIDRESAKTLNFASQYWCGVKKISQLLKCSMDKAQGIYTKYWDTYSGPRELKAQTDQEVLEGKPIVNLFGRKRHFSVENAKQHEVERAQRQAYNFKVQGPGGDLTNESFYLWSKRLAENGRGRALWTVHDEIVGEVRPEYAEEEKTALVGIMEGLGGKYGFTIPLKAKPYGPLLRWAKT